MDKKVKITLAIAGGVAVLLGVFYYFKKNAMKLMEMTYRFQNFKLKRATLSNMEVTSEVVLTNPSQLSFTITGYDVNVQFQGVNVVRLQKSDSNIPIPSNSSVTIPFDVQFDPRQVGASLLPLFLDVFVNKTSSEKLKLRYIGTISAKYGVVGISNIPIEYVYEMN
jgi:LEA14-like dessication related protein